MITVEGLTQHLIDQHIIYPTEVRHLGDYRDDIHTMVTTIGNERHIIDIYGDISVEIKAVLPVLIHFKETGEWVSNLSEEYIRARDYLHAQETVYNAWKE